MLVDLGFDFVKLGDESRAWKGGHSDRKASAMCFGGPIITWFGDHLKR